MGTKFIYLVVLVVLVPQVLLSQTKRPWTVFGFYGIHEKTDIVRLEGQGHFVGIRQKSVGLQSEKQLYNYKNILFFIGINGRLYLDTPIWFIGVEYPSYFYEKYPITSYRTYPGYIWDVSQSSISVPLGIKTDINIHQDYSFEPSFKVLPVFYFPTVDYESTLNLEYPRESWVFYEAIKAYTEYDDFNDRSIEVSAPKLEFQVDLRLKRTFKKNGALLFGILYRNGTQKLSETTITSFDFIPEAKTTGEFRPNMNFYALELGFEFGKHAPRQ